MLQGPDIRDEMHAYAIAPTKPSRLKFGSSPSCLRLRIHENRSSHIARTMIPVLGVVENAHISTTAFVSG